MAAMACSRSAPLIAGVADLAFAIGIAPSPRRANFKSKTIMRSFICLFQAGRLTVTGFAGYQFPGSLCVSGIIGSSQ